MVFRGLLLYSELHDAIAIHLPNVAQNQVYISQYPDPLNDANGNLCSSGWPPDAPLDYQGFFPPPLVSDLVSHYSSAFLGSHCSSWPDLSPGIR